MMSFSLTNTSASFQKYIIKILAKKFDILVIVYLNNILHYTKDDVDSHMAVVYWILEQLKKFSLYTILKKCQFHKQEV